MILVQRSAAQAEEWNQQQCSKCYDLRYAAGVLKPLSDGKAEHGYDDQKCYQRAGDDKNEPFVGS